MDSTLDFRVVGSKVRWGQGLKGFRVSAGLGGFAVVWGWLESLVSGFF